MIWDTTETSFQIIYYRVVHSRNQADHYNITSLSIKILTPIILILVLPIQFSANILRPAYEIASLSLNRG